MSNCLSLHFHKSLTILVKSFICVWIFIITIYCFHKLRKKFLRRLIWGCIAAERLRVISDEAGWGWGLQPYPWGSSRSLKAGRLLHTPLGASQCCTSMVWSKCFQKMLLGLGGGCSSELNPISSSTNNTPFFQTGFSVASHGIMEGEPRSPWFPGLAGEVCLPLLAAPLRAPCWTIPTGPQNTLGCCAETVPNTGSDWVLSRVWMGPFLDVNMTCPNEATCAGPLVVVMLSPQCFLGCGPWTTHITHLTLCVWAPRGPGNYQKRDKRGRWSWD